MKCQACGYEAEQDFCDGKEENNWMVKGDEAFVRISCFGKEFETNISKDNYYGNEYKKAHLHGCPKCNTVQFEINK